jgi:hypothetical protein
MTNTQIRQIIRNAADERGVKYRITAAGEVHFYGLMPNSIVTGWYLVHDDAAKLAADIQSGKF